MCIGQSAQCLVIGAQDTVWVGQLGRWAYKVGHGFGPIMLVSSLENNLNSIFYTLI